MINITYIIFLLQFHQLAKINPNAIGVVSWCHYEYCIVCTVTSNTELNVLLFFCHPVFEVKSLPFYYKAAEKLGTLNTQLDVCIFGSFKRKMLSTMI